MALVALKGTTRNIEAMSLSRVGLLELVPISVFGFGGGRPTQPFAKEYVLLSLVGFKGN